MSIDVECTAWIFVNYAPGSFGSFLTKVIELSTDVAGEKKSNIFDENNASHRHISSWIRNLHDGDEIDRWANWPTNQQGQYIAENINQQNTTLRRVHRFTVPKYNYKFRQHFTNAQFIKITVDKNYIDLVAQNMSNKTIGNWIDNKVTGPLKTILTRVSEEDQRKHYLDECRERIINIVDNTEEPNTFNFSVSTFFDSNEFISTVNRLTNWLEIAPVDCGVLHQEFLTRHKGLT